MSYFGIPIRNGLPIGLGSVAPLASGGGSPFSPLSLFSGGAPGAWYDPSDYSTLFQDSAGTTPVTAVEQPVGLMLDKSQGLVLGPAIATYDFASAAGWSTVGAVAITGGEVVFTATIDQRGVFRSDALFSVAQYYDITFTITSILSGAISVSVGQTNGNTQPKSTAGTHTVRVYGSGADNFVRIYSVGASTTASVDNVIIKAVAGNHAFQATSASRPVLSARYNLLTKTEDFSDADWVKSNVTAVNTTATTDPLGGNTADKIAETIALGTHGVFNLAPLQSTSGVVYTYSVYAKKAERSWLIIDAYTATNAFTWFDLNSGVVGTNASGNTASIENVGNGWFKCSVVRTSTSSLVNQFLGVYCSTSNGVNSYLGDGTSGLYIWGGSIVQTAQAPAAYQRVNTATDYATTGFLPYLRFDGVDDSLSTNSISFTSTDKMSVFAGVRKLSDVGANILVELSVAADLNNGSFNVIASNTGDSGKRFQFVSKGSLAFTDAFTTSTAYNAPISLVSTGLGDISGDRATLRLNGAQVGQSTADQGTGNYGNYPLYIGRRGGTSFPFNGQLYSMVIVGKAVTAGELSSTETYVNQKTGAY